jgi:acetyl-CoA C-acetyltransferase
LRQIPFARSLSRHCNATAGNLTTPTGRINVDAGAITIGHPIGASGARILVTLIYEMIKRDIKRGFASLCIGDGMGVALAIER